MPRSKGTPKTGGRSKGTPNKRTEVMRSALREASGKLGAALENGFDGDAHALLTAVYKNSDLPLDLRVHAAKAAIRYEKPAALPEVPIAERFSIAEEIRRAREILNGVPTNN